MGMKKLVDCWGEELVWRRFKPLQPHYELHAGDGVAARLTQGLVSAKGEAQTVEAHWNFVRVGMFRTRIVVRDVASQAEVAAMPWTGDRILEMANGNRFPLAQFNASGETGFVTMEGERLFGVQPGGFAKGHHAIVKVEEVARDLSELPLLLCLNWYAVMLAAKDAGQGAGAGGAIGGGFGR